MRKGEKDVCELGRENGPDLDSGKVMNEYNMPTSWIHSAYSLKII